MIPEPSDLDSKKSGISPSTRDESANISRYWRQTSNGDGSFDLTQCSVLVADDEPVVGKMTRDLVASRLHCHAELVSDGDAAIERLERQAFDVFIADMIMPGVQ